MKPLHRIAIALGVAQVAILATSRAAHTDPSGAPGHGRHGRHGHHRGHHGHPGPTGHAGRTGDHRRGRGPAGGPPPWVRERLAEWHREQHAEDVVDGSSTDHPDVD